MPVTLDEVQHVPEIFPVIKAAIDRHRQPGRFLLTGSANVMLLPKLSESLAGRMEVLTLWPFSQGEIQGVKENFVDTLFSQKPVGWSGKTAAVRREELLEIVVAGGYPPAVARQSAARRDAWFQSYVMTMLQRDIRDLAEYCRLDGRSTAAIGGGCPRGRFAEFRRFVENDGPAADDIETLLCLAGGDLPRATAAPLGEKPGKAGYSDSQGLLERHWAACLPAGSDSGPPEEQREMWPERFWRTLC